MLMVVRLHPTPWLHSSWAKKDILFLYDVKDNSEICIEKPYISRLLSKTNSSTASLAQNDTGFQEGIRSLGIMLLELCFNKAIESHELCSNINSTDQRIMQVLLYGIASDWARQVADETGHGYSDAIQWCLHYRLERMPDDSKYENWRDDMIAKVIEPLKTCYDQLSTV